VALNLYLHYTDSAGDVVIQLVASNGTGIALVIPATSLKGYAGGYLVTGPYESHWWWPDYSFRGNGVDSLLYGSLEP